MSDYYALFSDAMALAVVRGRKTVTRRPVALREFGRTTIPGYDWCFRDRRAMWNDVSTALLMQKFAPCAPGDTLVGRESFWQPAKTCCSEDQSGEREYYTKRANEAAYGMARPERPAPAGYVWERRPSIHMPRWASRIIRPILDVRVERLQDIDEADAVREGFPSNPKWDRSAVDEFASAWSSIYSAKGLGWDANPWVWRIEFGGGE